MKIVKKINSLQYKPSILAADQESSLSLSGPGWGCLLAASCPSNMLMYLGDRSAPTSVHDTTMRQKLQIKHIISHGKSFDTGPTSPSTDPIMPGVWQGSHQSFSFSVTGVTWQGKVGTMCGVSKPRRWGMTAGCGWGFEDLSRMNIRLNGKYSIYGDGRGVDSVQFSG